MAGPDTRQTLLLRIRDEEDGDSWRQFADIYMPLIQRFAIWRGLSREDAADVTQEVMRAVTRAIKDFNYDPKKGSFRSWLLTTTRRKIIDHVRKEGRKPIPAGGHTAIAILDAQSEPDSGELEVWEKDYRQRLFDWASSSVKSEFEEQTWSFFWKTAVEGEKGKSVAAMADVNVASVYTAKSRVLRRIREKVASVADEWDLYQSEVA